MRVYLADLFHVYQAGLFPNTSPYTVPLGIGYLASTVKRYLPDCEVRLFRDPDRLLAAVREEAPEVIGFSYCYWNSNLSDRLSEIVKEIRPDVITVAGGPSVDDADEQILDFFAAHPTVDYIVPNEGESGFLALLRGIRAGDPRQAALPGVAYLDDNGGLMRGSYMRPVVAEAPGVERISPKQVRATTEDDIEIPSPYLDGTLDEFLDEGLVPIIQTMRGCPYQCHFCVSGATEWNRMRGYDLARVRDEIDYALRRSGNKDLILTDENWGILGDRDVEIARFIMQRHERQGSPERLYYYTAKIVTDASREIVSMVAPIAWIGEFNMSFQSLNPDTRKAIKRTNINMDKLAQNIEWARNEGILTSSEMIYGFPYETPESFFDGIERLMHEGIGVVTMYPLQLFPGIDLASHSVRQEYGIETRFRLADAAFGVYDEGRIYAAEVEEVVVATRWSSVDDYFLVRRYGFFMQVLLGRGYFHELSKICREVGVSMEPLIRHLTMIDYAASPALERILAEHRAEAEAELKPTREEVYEQFAEQMRSGQEVTGVKINLVCLGKLMSSPEAIRELLAIVHAYVADQLDDHPACDLVFMYLEEVLPNRIVVLQHNVDETIQFKTRFDYIRWLEHNYRDLAEVALPEPRPFEAVVAGEIRRNLSGFDNTNRVDLQGIFDNTPSKYLMRTVKPGRAAAASSAA